MTDYFVNFPTINYNGSSNVIDITARGKISSELLANPFLFLPYTIQHDDKPEDIANLYYGDPSKVWLVYLANDIIDPYSDWLQTDTQLYQTVAAKYRIKENVSLVNAGIIENLSFAHTDPIKVTFQGNIPGITSGNTYYCNRISASTIGLSNTVEGDIIQFDSEADIMLETNIEEFLSSTAISSNVITCRSATNANVQVSYDTYLYAMGELERLNWEVLRVMDFEREQNEKRRTIWLINRDYTNLVSSDLRKVMLNGG